MLDLGTPKPALIGVVHLPPLPGSPRAGVGGIDAVLASATRDARAYSEGGADALIVENFGDVPFRRGAVEPETIAAMTLAVRAVQEAAPALPIGVNVLRNDARAALGICAATGASFLRVNVHTGAMWTDQGLIEGRAAETLRERARLAPAVQILADVHVKHAVPIAGERLVDAAQDALERGLADALVLSGQATGAAPDPAAVIEVRRAVGADARLVLGSGVTAENAGELVAHANGAIVGSSLKEGGELSAPVDRARVAVLAKALATLG